MARKWMLMIFALSLTIAQRAVCGPEAGKAADQGKQESASPAPAAGSSVFSWDAIKIRLVHLKQGLTSSAVERHYQSNRSVSAVAAVRGAPQKVDDPSKPYWKGTADSKKAQALKAERAELSAAVDLLLAGKIDEGKKGLDDFEAKHPKSRLIKDVRETREMILKAPPAPAVPSGPPK